MSQRLRVKECMIQLEREINTPIIDFFFDFNTIVFLINSEDRWKLAKNKPIIKKLSKQVRKYLNYISLPCSIREAAKQSIYPQKRAYQPFL